ncbi:MAG: GNAT family N-acetyltransferase [Oscillospiraceae bacterium]|nr:GNAT family N-acetyltransferase [Oscillospiraceae bacterium]
MILPIRARRLYIDEFDLSMAESLHISSLDGDNRRFVPDEVFETVGKARETLSWLVSCYQKRDAPLVYAIMLHSGENGGRHGGQSGEQYGGRHGRENDGRRGRRCGGGRGGRHIGHIQAVPIESGWEIGYHIAEPFTGNGYATEAIRAFLLPIMRHLGVSKMYGICHAENVASRRVLEKCGFALESESIAQYHGSLQPVCRYIFHDESARLVSAEHDENDNNDDRDDSDDSVGSVYGNVRRDKAYVNGLLDFIRQEYGLEPVDIAPAKRGFFGETWKMDTAGQSYFLKLDYSGAHKRIYERSFPIMEHMGANGIDFVSKIIKSADGRLSVPYDGAVLGVFDWIDGDNVQNEATKKEEYRMLAKIYTVPTEGLHIPREDFMGKSADLFYKQWEMLEDPQIHAIFKKNRAKLEHRAKRLKHFSAMCQNDTAVFAITHGDAGGNVIMDGDRYYIVDWDDPIVAPPERDAWFCLYWDWAMDLFNDELRKNGIDYELRPERQAYYCYHSFFYYLTEFMTTYFEIQNRGGDMAHKISAYFDCWIEDEIRYADSNFA